MTNNSVKTDANKLVQKHEGLIHSVKQKVVSHTQRDKGEWIMHTVMLDGVDVPFKFKRKDKYQSLNGARVNLTYYLASENVAGISFPIMNVVRIKRS